MSHSGLYEHIVLYLYVTSHTCVWCFVCFCLFWRQMETFSVKCIIESLELFNPLDYGLGTQRLQVENMIQIYNLEQYILYILYNVYNIVYSFLFWFGFEFSRKGFPGALEPVLEFPLWTRLVSKSQKSTYL